MPRIVVDASLTAAWCFPDERTDFSNALLLAAPSLELQAPSLWAYEIRNVLLMGIRRNRISHSDANLFLASLRSFSIGLVNPPSYDDVFSLSIQHKLTFYDAAYLDTAIRTNAALATLDRALSQAAEAAGVKLFTL